MAGSLGNDAYYLDNIGDVVSEKLNEGIDTVLSSVTHTLSVNVENLYANTSGAINLTGNALDNLISAGAGNNVLEGAAGIDMVTYYSSASGVTVNLNTTTAQATGGSGSDTLLNIESLEGSVFNDVLTGNAGANVLAGAAGADTMIGGQGNDTYYVDNAGDVVTENLGEGVDTVLATGTYILTANVENLTLLGTAAISGGGNVLNNVLTGNSAANTLDGGAGADTMVGGLGNDAYVVDNAGDVVTEGANEGVDTVFTSISYAFGDTVEHLYANSASAINLTGNALNNLIVAGAGNNIINGGVGIDTASYYYATSGVTANLNIVTAQATGGSGSDTLVNIENLEGSIYNDVLTGNAEANALSGGAGADTMAGGLGNDNYLVDNIGDVVSENLNEGVDTVLSSVNHSLGSNLENLFANSSGAINLTGNALDNLIAAGAGNNVLDGAAGEDTASFYFAASGVTVNLSTTTAQATGGSGSDTLLNIEDLEGSNYNDVLTGNAAANVLIGGAGADTLTGGQGDDTYSLARGYGNDTIQENDATAGNADIGLFDIGIATDQLWFRQVSNNLEVSIIGTADKFSVTNWYLGNQYHMEQFKTSDGKTLLDSQVQNLVSAMAAFAPPAMGETTLSAAYASQLNPVIAANWQ